MKFVPILLLICIFSKYINAQEIRNETNLGLVNNKTLKTVLVAEGTYYLSSMLILQNTWYKDRKKVPFHFYNDNKAYLQVDKFGHAFGAYVESYIGYKALLKSGVSKENALLFGGTLGFVLQTPIEIMDGIHEGWGFSWGDMTANAIGSGLFISQELIFNEQLFLYKFSYWESQYSKNANGYLGETTLERLLDDYNGHTYWLSMPLNKFTPKMSIPCWMNIAIGYSANGMYGEYKNITKYNGIDIPLTTRYRQFLFSLDIDWTKIKTNSKFLKILLKGMTFVKLPFPTLEYNSKGNFKGHWLYY